MSMVLVYLKKKKDRITLLHPAAIKSRKKGSVLVVTILELSLQKNCIRVAFHLCFFLLQVEIQIIFQFHLVFWNQL